MLHVEKLKEQSKDPQIACQTGENTLQIVLATKAIHLTGFCCSWGAPRSLVKHSEACWITLQTALSYLHAIKIEFNLNIHPLKVTAIILKVKILLHFSKVFLNGLTLLALVSEQSAIGTLCSCAEDLLKTKSSYTSAGNWNTKPVDVLQWCFYLNQFK